MIASYSKTARTSFSRLKSLSLLIMAGLILSACTATKPPDYRAMANRNEIVPGEEITVQRSENLYAFTKRNNVRMSEVIALNNLKPPFVVRPGQKIVLPTREETMPLGEDGAPLPRPAPLTEIKRMPLDSRSSSGITTVPLDAPATAKPAAALQAPTQSPMAQATLTPLPVKDTATPTSFDAPLKPATQKAPTQTTVAETTPDTNITAAHASEETTQPAPTKQDWKPKSTGVAPTFIWPIQGPILSGYGIKGQGLNNDGINIAAPKGAPVVASAGGMVAYAGNDMKGFGNLILIRHEGGWVTAYAHLDRMIVTKDSAVASGDMIGTVGTSGGVAAPQLHFETRQEGKPVDPEGVIKK